MSEDLLQQEIVWVDQDDVLEQVCEAWQNKPLLALDTEFMRTSTYYPIAGLIQVNDGEKNYLIDPTKITDFYPFAEILDNENIVKVLHSCSEDLEVFQRALDCLPQNIFDTQVAGALAGYGFSVGFGKLALAVLDVDLPKSETRSDWLQRPLSQSQIHYAALDVEYLFTLANSLMVQLNEKQRLPWAMEDSQRMVDNFFANQDPDRTYLKFKSAWKLDEQQLAILKLLSRWREDEAQAKDIPRNRLVKESAIYSIALKKPSAEGQLYSIEGLTSRMIRSYGDKFLSIVEDVVELPSDQLPVRLPRPLCSEERNVLDKLKQVVLAKAEEMSLPSEVLMRKKDYEEILITARDQVYRVPTKLHGWRKSVIADKVVETVKQLASE